MRAAKVVNGNCFIIFRKAITSHTQRVIGLNPTEVDAYINFGLAYYHQGNYQKAIALYYRECAIALVLNSQYAIASLTSIQSDISDRFHFRSTEC